MSQAAGFTVGFSIIAVGFLFILFQNGVFTGLIWFPFYLFVTILLFPGSVLFKCMEIFP